MRIVNVDVFVFLRLERLFSKHSPSLGEYINLIQASQSYTCTPVLNIKPDVRICQKGFDPISLHYKAPKLMLSAGSQPTPQVSQTCWIRSRSELFVRPVKFQIKLLFYVDLVSLGPGEHFSCWNKNGTDTSLEQNIFLNLTCKMCS